MQLVIGKQVFDLNELPIADHKDFLYANCGGDTGLKVCHGAFTSKLTIKR